MSFPKLQNTLKNRISAYSLGLILTFSAGISTAQTVDSLEILPHTIILSAEVSGFIPIRETYRLNYESDLAGLPLEIAGSMQFPVDRRLSAGVGLRYRRRVVTFVPDVSLRAFELEPGINYYLEEPQPNELRITGDVGLLLTRVTIDGTLASSTDGQSYSDLKVSQNYLNLGFGVGLALEYPLSDLSGLFAHLHLSTYFLDPIETGGLGNIGGISVGVGYKISL